MKRTALRQLIFSLYLDSRVSEHLFLLAKPNMFFHLFLQVLLLCGLPSFLPSVKLCKTKINLFKSCLKYCTFKGYSVTDFSWGFAIFFTTLCCKEKVFL